MKNFGASKEAQTHKQATQAQSQAFAQKWILVKKDGEKDHPHHHNVRMPVSYSDHMVMHRSHSWINFGIQGVVGGFEDFPRIKENFNKSQPSLPEFEPRLQTT